MCTNLSTVNSSLTTNLSSLGSQYASAIKFEDPGSFQTKLSNLNKDNAIGITKISNACTLAMGKLSEDIAFYQEENRKETQRLLRAAAEAAANASVWSQNV